MVLPLWTVYRLSLPYLILQVLRYHRHVARYFFRFVPAQYIQFTILSSMPCSSLYITSSVLITPDVTLTREYFPINGSTMVLKTYALLCFCKIKVCIIYFICLDIDSFALFFLRAWKIFYNIIQQGVDTFLPVPEAHGNQEPYCRHIRWYVKPGRSRSQRTYHQGK